VVAGFPACLLNPSGRLESLLSPVRTLQTA
jgi:hypothetical protein